MKDKNGVTLKPGQEVAFAQRDICGHAVSRAQVKWLHVKDQPFRWVENADGTRSKEYCDLTLEFTSPQGTVHTFPIKSAEVEVKGK